MEAAVTAAPELVFGPGRVLELGLYFGGPGGEGGAAAVSRCRCPAGPGWTGAPASRAAVPGGGTVSVQPWHRTQKAYEQSSLMFNLLQIGANGAAMAEPVQMGLYGPVILMSPADYWQIGGHETVRGSIVEDVALGLALKQAGLPYKTFIGDESVAFRMYPGGFRSLIQGWTKNLASGAAKAPLHLLILTFLWITSMMSVPVQLIRYGILGEFQWVILYAALYLVWILFLVKTVPRIGRFRPWIIALYPVSLVLMVWVFAVSLFNKLSGRKVLWKGRAIDTGGKPCE